jgi:hypothetical protein
MDSWIKEIMNSQPMTGPAPKDMVFAIKPAIKTRYHMDDTFKELAFKKLDTLILMHLNKGLITKDKMFELIGDLKCIMGLNPDIELKRILVEEQYASITNQPVPDSWWDQYRDELEYRATK